MNVGAFFPTRSGEDEEVGVALFHLRGGRRLSTETFMAAPTSLHERFFWVKLNGI